ncbi:MAG TPA: helix-hairpin-helix domain-containing protein [Thermoanaerobaculia bacterium]|jgi:competence protein ComEA|nr:helix-hairpin-helix domain-containing protein [Thermoanaerobaculia bacterium]
MRKSPAILLLGILILSLATAALADVPGVVNINTADTAQLSYLPRVGAKAAQQIIDYRTAHGPFHKTTDLMQVKGFGQKRYEKLSSYLVVEGKTTLGAKVSSPRKPRKPTTTASK